MRFYLIRVSPVQNEFSVITEAFEGTPKAARRYLTASSCLFNFGLVRSEHN